MLLCTKNVHMSIPALRPEAKGFKHFAQKMEEVSFKVDIQLLRCIELHTNHACLNECVSRLWAKADCGHEVRGWRSGVRWPVAHQEGQRDFISSSWETLLRVNTKAKYWSACIDFYLTLLPLTTKSLLALHSTGHWSGNSAFSKTDSQKSPRSSYEHWKLSKSAQRRNKSPMLTHNKLNLSIRSSAACSGLETSSQ